MLASTSKAPVLHHLSSVGAKIPAPTRLMYSATKGAALMAVETCRVECEGTGVRFFCMSPHKLCFYNMLVADRHSSDTAWNY